MDVVLGAVLVIGGLAVLYVTTRRPRARERPADQKATLVLETEHGPEEPSVQRLVTETIARTLETRPDVEEVEVLGRSGLLLGGSTRAGFRGGLGLPPSLVWHRTHASPIGPRTELGVHEDAAASPQVELEMEPRPPKHRALVEMFDLPDAVRAQIRDPESAAAIVRAILAAAGHANQPDSDLFVVGGHAVVVLPTRTGQVATSDELNHAYHRFRSSGARDGVVVTTGLVYPDDVRRREALAPQLRHEGPEGIQRLADAVAVGADPVRFIAGVPARSA